ncbi:MAG: T9SS type A sorting domain-containing protein [Flavipsychrobacter sp.]|nr:T9SS type A sorting domain-containing protein [Flavipsychrobacter sp.]
MKKILLPLFIGLFAVVAQTNAQTLIHYWNFNNPAYTTAVYKNPGIPAFKADYSAIDTNKALFVYHLVTGASSTYAGYIDFVAVSAGTPDFDSLNLRPINSVATPSGNAIRFRSPSDSAYLTFNIPTTGYKNITLKFAIETSNTTTSATNQAFAYSTDSGATWKTASLSTAKDTVTPVFSLITVTFGADSAVNNNPKLIFKVTNTVRLLAGNVRFDNISVDGTAITTGGGGTGGSTLALVHYWNFNNFSTAYHNPGIPAIKADYSVLDTNITALKYTLLSGTSSAYAGYVDDYPVTTADSDRNDRTVNGVATPDGNSFRFRNPSDSAYLLFYIPSLNYKNLVFSYAVEASSFTSGMLKNYYYYSVDSGTTWLTSGLSEAFDTTTLAFSLKTIQITDPAAYNNAKLVFKIVPQGNTAGTSGNNRFDNVTLDGVAIDTAYHYHHVAVPNVIANTATPVLYPNPAGNNVFINTFAEGDKAVAIYNMAGQRVFTTVSSDKVLNINMAQLATGIYYANVRLLNGAVFTMKFVKQ